MRSLAPLWRMLVTHRRLLEWNPSAADEPDRRRFDDTTSRSELAASIKSMWIAPAIATTAAILLTVSAPSALAVAAPILFLWFVSPGIAWWISRPLASPRSTADDGPDALPPQARAKDLGVLRDLRRPGRPMASAGQLPGASGRERRASHVADEHGTCAAGESDCLRLWLHPGRTTHPAHGECNEHDEVHGTARGALLQLVRHTVAEAAAASLCLGGGQREPRGSSDDLAARTARACRRQDHGCCNGSKA